MRWSGAWRVLFILYCLEVGVFLTLAPWSRSWERVWLELPAAHLYGILLHSAFRGLVSGFGLVHLVWGIHDVYQLLVGRHAPEGTPADPADHAG